MCCSAFLPTAKRSGARVLLILALVAGAIGSARADSVPLLLEVTLNGTGKNLVGNFLRDEAGEIAALVRELEEVGVKAPAGKGREDVVALHAAGVTYDYDEARQTIAITAPLEALATQKFDLLAPPEGVAENLELKPQRNLGALLNYTLFASGADDLPRGRATYNGSLRPWTRASSAVSAPCRKVGLSAIASLREAAAHCGWIRAGFIPIPTAQSSIVRATSFLAASPGHGRCGSGESCCSAIAPCAAISSLGPFAR
ncbi:MAG: fimbrial usher protein [Hyphomicrobiales bacterium]|nr:fimbrial usher protein [Hyphomicrobiales bacterium]